jgi:hypothetical protein
MTSKTLPDFIVIGAMRAGTTSLHNYFEFHPQVGMTRTKEPEFFLEAKFGKGLEWYSQQFEDGPPVLGEASPNYSKVDIFPGVPQRIHSVLPDVRLIYVVRDPVDRFVSQYRHMKSRGFDLPDPGPMCAAEPDLPDEPVRLTLAEPYRHILSTSCYARQLRAYLQFFPPERVKIVEFEALQATPVPVLAELQDFLGLDRLGGPTLPTLNRSQELGRLPSPILRSARETRLGSWLRDRMSLRARDRFKRVLAAPFPARDLPFPEQAIARIKRDLARDLDDFRRLTGRPFANWSV